MKIAIMQPYFFPYIGYWQLINTVDKFIILDDVNFIKKGYINRNFIISNNNRVRINLPINKISQNKLIINHTISDDEKWKNKLLLTIKQNYNSASFYKSVFPLLENIILYKEQNLSNYLHYQIIKITEYLKINTEIIETSTKYNIIDKKGQERILDICKKENAKTYINAIGGKELYSVDEFKKNGIELKFIKTGDITYKQFNNEFIPNLSIIDVMMHNSVEEIKQMLNSYTLE